MLERRPLRLAAALLFGSTTTTTLLVLPAVQSFGGTTTLKMSTGGGGGGKGGTSVTDVANFAVRQSPTTTRFVTNKMCPYAQKAWIALEVCKAPYEMDEISLYGPNGKPDWFLELNPSGTVPVLVCHGGAVVLPDSELILDCLQDGGAVEGGEKLRPGDEGRMENVKRWRRIVSERVAPVGKDAVQRGGNKQVDSLFDLLREIDEDVEGPYLCGDSVTAADCAAFPFLWRIDREFGPLNAETHGCGKIRKWLDECLDAEAFRKTVQGSWWWWW